MYKQIAFRIESAAPLLMHSGEKLINPLHPLTKEIKRFSGKKKKTDEDLMALSKLEWIGGLYLTEDPEIEIKGGSVLFKGGGVPCLPDRVLTSAIVNGGKKHKLGTQFRSGLLIEGYTPLEYEGARDAEGLWQDQNFVDMQSVKIQRSAIIRTRPIFKKWAAEFVVNYLPDVLNVEQITEALDIAGRIIGLCDLRPTYGRFNVVS